MMSIPIDAKISMCDAEGVALKNMLSRVLRSTKCKISKSSCDFNESVYPIPFYCSLIGKNHALPAKFCNLTTDSASKSHKCAAFFAYLYGNVNTVPETS